MEGKKSARLPKRFQAHRLNALLFCRDFIPNDRPTRKRRANLCKWVQVNENIKWWWLHQLLLHIFSTVIVCYCNFTAVVVVDGPRKCTILWVSHRLSSIELTARVLKLAYCFISHVIIIVIIIHRLLLFTSIESQSMFTEEKNSHRYKQVEWCVVLAFTAQ